MTIRVKGWIIVLNNSVLLSAGGSSEVVFGSKPSVLYLFFFGELFIESKLTV
jgi:hypothetical protein